MPDFLTSPFAQAPNVAPWNVFGQLLVALLLGGVVAWIYVKTSKSEENGVSLPTTLVLLCILIAMVTQVIGNNVARAFSLVGALSIVRFRTVVRDTRDTAYVIFAVVVGMAVGAQTLWVAAIGIVIVAIAAFVMANRTIAPTMPDLHFLLTVRMGLGHDLEGQAGGVLDAHLLGRELTSVNTARQGASLGYVYRTRLRPGGSAEELVKALNRIEGVQDVRLERRCIEQG